jgi:hypothetical protein
MGMNMRERILILPALLLMIAVPTAAGELWKKKPVNAWSREEAQEFFRNSPWVRRVSVQPGLSRPDSSAFSGSVFDAPGLSGNLCPSCTGLEPPRERPSAAGSGVESGSGTRGRAGGVYFIQWTSAEIVRRVISHLRALDGLGKELEDFSILPTYLLTVGGADLSPFDGTTEAELKAATYLRAKRAATQIEPLRVTTQKRSDGHVTSVHFEFPRQIAGQPAIADREGSVEFCCKLKDFTLRTSFNLSKMNAEHGRDL